MRNVNPSALRAAVVLVACSAGNAWAQQESSSAGRQEVVDRIVNEVAAKPFGTPRRQWRDKVPAATWIEFRGETGYPSEQPSEYRWPVGNWCAIADDKSGSVSRQAVFYGIQGVRPRDCSLAEITFTIDIGNNARTSEVYGELILALTRKLGHGYPLGPNYQVVELEAKRRAYGSPRHGFMQWTTGNYEVLVFIAGLNVGVAARHDALTRLLDSRDPLPEPDDIDQALREQVLQPLRGSHPEIAELVVNTDAVPDVAPLVAAASTLLGALSRAISTSDRAWLALAAEEVVLRLALFDDRPLDARPELSPLKPFQLEFEFDGHAGMWMYKRGLSDAVIRRYAETEWAELALVRKILGGWDLTQCQDSYRDAIKHGQEWLSRNADSRYRLIVTQAVAQAYESWWSLSKAPDYDEFGSYSRDEATPGGEQARLHAIDWYERLLQIMPGGLPTDHIERTLTHLTAGVDTGQRRFHCVVP